MTEKELFNRLNASVSTSHSCDFEDNGNKYSLIISFGNYSCDYTISTRIKNTKNAQRLVNLANNQRTMNQYSINKNLLSLTTHAWIDKKPTITSMEEIIRISIAELNTIKSIIEEEILNG